MLAYTAAIGLASVAALFSVRGMVQMFPGTPLLIVAMASMMEASKLIAAGWLAMLHDPPLANSRPTVP